MKFRLLFSLAFCVLAFNAFAQITSIGIIGSATPTGWDSDTDMTKVNDSTWTITINLTAGNACKFRADDAWTINWGSTDFPFGTGTQGGADIPVPVTAAYTVTFNSNSGAYEFSVNSPIGVIGDATPKGWGEDTNLFQDSLDANKFYHVLNLKKGEAKFRFNDDWARNWGATGFPSGTATQDGPNIPIPSAGRYRIDFDTLTGVYAFTLIPEYKLISVIGDATAGGWSNDTPLKQDDENPSLWVGNVDLTVGSLKFRADSAWTFNWGGTTFPSGTAVPNGDNIPVGTAGRYQARIDVKKLEYDFLVIRPYQTMGIIGSANPGGFDNPTPMTEDPNQEGLWKARVVLKDGDLIFKADDDLWSAGDFPTGVAELDGAPIPIPAGEYKIEFDQITGAYSFELLVIYTTVGLIGPATPIGTWDTDVDMTKDPNDEMFWFIPNITLNENECKFRAEDNWSVNWGAATEGTAQEEPSGIATQDGKNFKVKAGVYGITLRAVKNEGEYMFGAPLSSPELIKRTSMKLSPNPTKNVLNIELIEPSLGGDVVLNIFNSQGVRVYANNINIQEYATIQLGDLAPGVYWLHMTNGKYFAGKQFIVSE
ncbi:MAG: SusF/SusE family outer membrane protein [Saprospiraceae bacterium]|nr:SusF/SusE family outer membrane protein [Saprospiraceae bacterium]